MNMMNKNFYILNIEILKSFSRQKDELWSAKQSNASQFIINGIDKYLLFLKGETKFHHLKKMMISNSKTDFQ